MSKQPEHHPAWYYPAVFFVGALAGVFILWIAYLSTRPSITVPLVAPPIVVPPTPVPTPTPEPVPEPVPAPVPTPEPAATSSQDLTSATLNVVWTEPIKREPGIVFSVAGYTSGISRNSDFEELLYEKGYVRDGKYKNHRVFAWRQAEQGLGMWYWMDVILLSPDGKEARQLARSYQPEGGLIRPYEISAPNLRIPTTAFPAELKLPNGKKVLKSSDFGTPEPLCNMRSCPGIKTISQTQDGFTLFARTEDTGTAFEQLGESCLIAFDELGNSVTYVSIIGYGTAATDDNNPFPDAIGPPDLQWNAGINTTSTYIPSAPGGCGFRACADLFSDYDARASGTLVIAGRTKAGDPLYVPQPLKTHWAVQSAYENWMAYAQDGQKPDIDEFLRQNPVPIFFWRDSFGRWVRYVMTTGVPMGECGKPVIYLYPEATTNVSVRLPSFIKVTKSDPKYPAKGWNVSAHPDGTLIMPDGAKYGSLFWEGTGVGYDRPKDGFIVKDGEVDARLAEILARYGLNATESREFRDFWVPRMTGSPYYRVSFLTSAWSSAAPLTVSPAPRTQIRIFMDWQKLSAPISMPEPKIVTPVRNGFTLVEWGGTLWK